MTQPDRRDPSCEPERTRLTPEEQAVLIKERRFGNKRPADLSDQQFSGDGAVKRAVVNLFDRLEGKLSSEQLQLQELVRSQFAGELSIHKEFELYDAAHPSEGDVVPPDAETAAEVLLTRLSPEQIAAILKMAKNPQFQLEALTSFERYVTALDKHKKMPLQIDTYVNDNRRAAWASQDAAAGIGNNIIGWNVGIIDSAQELEPEAGLQGNLGQKRIQAEEKLQKAGLRLPHPRRYALAQMRALQQGKPLDAINWSVLNDDTGDKSVVPGGDWDGDRVFFDGGAPVNQYAAARFRPEVVAKV